MMRLLPIDENPSSEVEDACRLSVHIAQVVEATQALYSRRGFVPPWIGYVALMNDEFVGSCGFASPPEGGEVEIAYFTFPGHEGRGVAFRMATELLAITRAASSGLVYIAHTLPGDGPSTSILRKMGFRMIGQVDHPDDGLVWKWKEEVSCSLRIDESPDVR